MTRVAHLSDLHFGEANEADILALARDIGEQAVDAVVVSGDLTRRAERDEFISAIAFLEALGKPLLVVPGNHDIPRFNLYSRFLHPKRRWLAARPAGSLEELDVNGWRFLGLDTVSRAQWHLDWAAGAIPASRRDALRSRLIAAPANGKTILVCHHPLRHPAWAGGRRPPREAEATLGLLRETRVAAVLCGHLHRAEVSRLLPGEAWQIVAPSALSPRGERAVNGWNLIQAADELLLETRECREGAYVARPVLLDKP